MHRLVTERKVSKLVNRGALRTMSVSTLPQAVKAAMLAAVSRATTRVSRRTSRA